MKIKRIGVAAIALAAAGALTLSGCASGTPASTAPAGDPKAIISANSTEPQNPLIPSNTSEVGGGRVVQMIYSGLVYYDVKGNPHNDVAESITTTDSQNFTIKIKSGQKFTDGEPVNSDSFIKAWNYGAADSTQLLNSYYAFIDGYNPDKVKEMSGLKKVDDTTFTVKLQAPQSDFPLQLGYAAFYPLPESAWKDLKAFGESPVGNGPYKMAGAGAWKHNQEIDLVKNDDYTGPRAAKNGGITFKLYAQEDAAYADVQSGALDLIDQIPASALKTYETDLPGRSVSAPAAVIQTFTIPGRLPHFSGEEGALRRAAISHAIDRAEITKVVFSNKRVPAKDFLTPVITGYSENIPGSDVLKFDVAKAKDLWKQADAISPWSGKFQVAYNADSSHRVWVDAMMNQLKNNLGIDAEGAPYPTFKQMRSAITDHSIQTAFRSGWQADYPGILDFLQPLYVTGAGSNDGQYSNPEVDKLITDGANATDQKVAMDKFHKAEEILFKDLPAIPLWTYTTNGAWGKTVSNVNFGWDGQPLYYEITKTSGK